MHYCGLTLPSPEENLACDEALLDWAEARAQKFAEGRSAAGSAAASLDTPMAHVTFNHLQKQDAAAAGPSALRQLQNGILRFWEPTRYFVVLGYGNRTATEVNTAFCRQNTIPILRRRTGGGTVLQGPGILNYTLVLPAEAPPLHNVTAANRFIMGEHRRALASL